MHRGSDRLALPEACARVTRVGLVVLLIFTPLAFGTVEDWSIALMEWGVVTLFLIEALGRLWPRPEVPKRAAATGIEVPVVLFLLLCLLQTVPIPAGWIETISPGAARAYRAATLEVPPAAGAVPADAITRGDVRTSRPLSLDPGSTWARTRQAAAFLLLFLLIVRWADRGRRIVFLISTVVVVGFIVALHGLVQYLSWNGKIYWIRKVPPSSSFGPFVNHNHFAGYVEMVIPLAVALALYVLELRRRSPGRAPGRAVIASRDEERGRWGQSGLTLFATVVLVVALIFSRSRGGMLSAILSGVVLFALVWRRIASRALIRSIAVVLPVVVFLLAAWISADIVGTHVESYRGLESEASFRSRVLIWNSVVRNIGEFKWVGAGLGAFERSFAPHTPAGSARRWDKAHNDYLQILWETGIAGAALFTVALAIFALRFWLPALRSRAHPLDLFGVAIAVSLMSIALHSLVDFNLQIGANGFLCTVLAGLLVAVHRVSSREDGGRPMLVDLHRERP